MTTVEGRGLLFALQIQFEGGFSPGLFLHFGGLWGFKGGNGLF